jgi:hypothetical protein
MIRSSNSYIKQRKRGKSFSPEKYKVDVNLHSSDGIVTRNLKMYKILAIVFLSCCLLVWIWKPGNQNISDSGSATIQNSYPICVADRSLDGWIIYNASPFASFRTISGYSRSDCEPTDNEHILFLTHQDGFNPHGFQVELLKNSLENCPSSPPTIIIQCSSLSH